MPPNSSKAMDNLSQPLGKMTEAVLYAALCASVLGDLNENARGCSRSVSLPRPVTFCPSHLPQSYSRGGTFHKTRGPSVDSAPGRSRIGKLLVDVLLVWHSGLDFASGDETACWHHVGVCSGTLAGVHADVRIAIITFHK